MYDRFGIWYYFVIIEVKLFNVLVCYNFYYYILWNCFDFIVVLWFVVCGFVMENISVLKLNRGIFFCVWVSKVIGIFV